MLGNKNQSVNAHNFAMIPRPDVPRAAFRRQTAHKTTFDSGYLVPFFVDEVLPGDTFAVNAKLFARLATPIYPIMDNLYLDSFWFFVPNRLIWIHWVNFCGEQANPTDTISYTIPQSLSPVGGYLANTIHDYFGLPTAGQVNGVSQVAHSALPLRAYNLIWNQWFRDENLQNSIPQDNGDGTDTYSDYQLQRRGKRHDYFTSALPWPQKGATGVSIPLGTTATIRTNATDLVTGVGANPSRWLAVGGAAPTLNTTIGFSSGAGGTGQNLFNFTTPASVAAAQSIIPSNLYADLSTATAASINTIRQAVTIQQLLERNARSGTRYTEYVLGAFGVHSPDARLQRAEFLGGATQAINISPVAQTMGTGATGTTTPMGTLAGAATTIGSTGFTQSFTEHGHIIGLMSVRADLTYQQGMRKLWSRSTLYDFYDPKFANLGEQAILEQEIYVQGIPAQDTAVWGYQERWAEYRYFPTMITGQYKSTFATPLDAWHLAQHFSPGPTLNTTFIQDTPPVSRVVAIGAASTGQQLLFDSFIDMKCTRPIPLFSVPGLARF